MLRGIKVDISNPDGNLRKYVSCKLWDYVQKGNSCNGKTKKKCHETYKFCNMVLAKVGTSLVWTKLDLSDSLRWSIFVFQADVGARIPWKFSNATGSNKS